MAIFWGDKVVAIHFIPNVVPVPTLSAKGIVMHDSVRIRKVANENNRPEIESESFVRAMIDRRLGETVPLELYDELRELIRTMFRT